MADAKGRALKKRKCDEAGKELVMDEGGEIYATDLNFYDAAGVRRSLRDEFGFSQTYAAAVAGTPPSNAFVPNVSGNYTQVGDIVVATITANPTSADVGQFSDGGTVQFTLPVAVSGSAVGSVSMKGAANATMNAPAVVARASGTTLTLEYWPNDQSVDLPWTEVGVGSDIVATITYTAA